MPTENRSSNTDPRDVFIRLNPLGLGEAELRKDSTGFEDQRTHSDYLLFLAGYRETHPEPLQHTEQHQGEPVAWQVRSKTNRPESQWTPWKECCEMTRAMHSHEVGRFNQFGIMREMRPLYSHADPGEVERLREEIKHLRDGWYKDESDNSRYWPEQLQEAKSELAERDALLQDLLDYDISTNARRRIEEALSASPIPEVKS